MEVHPDHYLSTSEAAQVLNISPSTMRAWARKGRIGYLATVHGWRYYRAGDVYALREARKAQR
ncbi:helix-turn-helix domain-containing protein [Allosalinactinospora lopnorensis]|uniref:helix-turn-helix domain-containing protein n=1 Tax=Allosalinactinospora lopnorensis TaxID=1352348 RepID=UPI000623F159|nr:helix-turn-helix domain-containing protein [Allosalinactinospora lopnorensis]